MAEIEKKPGLNRPLQESIAKIEEALSKLELRLGFLEEALDEIDSDFLTAGKTFDQIEAKLANHQTRLDQLQPDQARCRDCGRVLRSITRKCSVCGTQN